MQIYNSIISIPWCLKIFIGIITDNVKICGLKRKPYLIIFGAVQTATMFIIYYFEFEDPVVVVLIFFLTSLAVAFLNVVIESLLVIQQRIDPENGSQDLVSIMYFFQGLGGVVGCIIAAFMTENYHPKYCFLAYSIWGLLVTISACFLKKEAESDPIYMTDALSHESSELLENQTPSEAEKVRSEMTLRMKQDDDEGFGPRFRKNMSRLCDTIKRKEIVLLIVYFVIEGVTQPNF